MEEHDAGDCAEQAEITVEAGDGQERYLQWNDQQRDDEEEQSLTALELDPCERVAGHGGDQNHQERGGHCDHHGVDQRSHHIVVVEDVLVRLEGELLEVDQRIPPARRRDISGGPETRHEKAEGRHDPEERHPDQQHVQRPAGGESLRQRRSFPSCDGVVHGRCGHHPSLLNRLMFSAMIGITRRNRTTARAAPTPGSPSPVKVVR